MSRPSQTLRNVLPIALAATVAALALSAVAAADKEKLQFTASGQADALAAVLKRADLGTTATWTGGTKKPDLSNSLAGCSYRPKESDLTMIGAAETDWKTAGLELDSEANVLETPAMVRLDWQRTIAAPQVLPCLHAALAKAIKPPQRLISIRRIAFPQLTQYARAYRVVIDVKTSAGPETEVMLDFLAIGQGQTELSLTTTAPYAARTAIAAAELRVAEILISRVRA